MIKCICPVCGKEIDYYDLPMYTEFTDVDTYYNDYFVDCECGAEFTFTEFCRIERAEVTDLKLPVAAD